MHLPSASAAAPPGFSPITAGSVILKCIFIFHEELQSCMSSNYNVTLKQQKLLMSLLNDHQKQSRFHVLDTDPFEDAFGPKKNRKRPKLLASDYESLLKKVVGSQDTFEQKRGATTSAVGNEVDGFRAWCDIQCLRKVKANAFWVILK